MLTPGGYKRPDDKDWIIEVAPGVVTFIADHAMQYLAKREETKPGS